MFAKTFFSLMQGFMNTRVAFNTTPLVAWSPSLTLRGNNMITGK